MRIVARLIGCLVLSVLLVSVFSSYYQAERERFVLRRELEQRADVLAESLQPRVESMLHKGDTAGIKRLVDHFVTKQQLAGLVVYGEAASPMAISKALTGWFAARPETLSLAMKEDAPRSAFLRLNDHPVHFRALPLHDDDHVVGGLLVVHDAAYIVTARRQAWRDMSVRVLAQVLLIIVVTIIMFQRSVVKPIARTAAWMRELRHGRNPGASGLGGSDVLKPLANEAHIFAQSLAEARASAEQEARMREAAQSSWTAERLAVSLRTRLNGSRLFVISNREPYMHTRKGNAVEIVVPASGLVTALEPILRACDGTWIAHGSGDADPETVDANQCVRVPPEDPRYTLRRVWLSKEEEAAAITTASPTRGCGRCATSRTPAPRFRAGDWEEYQRVNAEVRQRAVGRDARGRAAHRRRPGLSLRAAAAHDQAAPSRRAGRHFLAHPVAEPGGVRHLPVAGANCWTGCWERTWWAFTSRRTATIFSRRWTACWNRASSGSRRRESRRASDHGAPVPDQHRDAASACRARRKGRTRTSSRRNCCAKSASSALYIGDRRRPRGLHQGHRRAHAGRGTLPGKVSGVSGTVHLRADRRPQPHQDPALPGLSWTEVESDGRAHQPPLPARASGSPSSSATITTPTPRLERFYRAADLCMVTSLHDGMNLVAKEFVAARDDERWACWF